MTYFRGSSFAVMSMRAKESAGKRVSFDPVSTQNTVQSPTQVPNSLPIKDTVREDPNVSKYRSIFKTRITGILVSQSANL